MNEVALGQVFLPVLRCVIPPVLQTGEAWEPSEKLCSFGTRVALERKVLSFFFRLNIIVYSGARAHTGSEMLLVCKG